MSFAGDEWDEGDYRIVDIFELVEQENASFGNKNGVDDKTEWVVFL